MLVVALLAQLAITVNGPDTGSVCLPMQLTAAIRTPGRASVMLAAPSGAGIQVLRNRVVSRVDLDGAGQPSTLTEASVEVATALAGRVTIPPFVATVDGRRVASAPLIVDVRRPISPPPVVLVRARLDDLPTGTMPESLLVGEQVNYLVDVLLNEPARSRLRRNATYFPPEMASVLAYDVSAPASAPAPGGRCFASLTYRRALFPLFPGRVAIPPAVLTYSLPLSSSFFSREESFEQRTDSVVFSAIEAPALGRPRDFAGAVGTFRLTARVASPSARLGDPVVVTVRVDAVGNVKLLPRPAFALDWATLTPGEERVRVDSSGARIGGSKEFDWIVTPRQVGAQTIAPIRYPFYDPDARRYAFAETAPIAFTVTPGSLATSDTATGPRLPIRLVMRPERGAPLSSQPVFWMLLALAPVPATLRRLFRRRRWRVRAPTSSKRLRLAAAARDAPAARDLRRLYLDALRERVPAAGRGPDPLGRTLRRAGVSDGTSIEAESLLAQLDDAAFSPGGTLGARTLRESLEIVDAVHREAAPAHVVGSALPIAMLLMFAMAATMVAAVDGAERSFADGVRAYQHGQLSVATRRFGKAATEAPRAVDAWANLASSAWENGDSAQAARAWHQALRLDPLDAEARERLGAIQLLRPGSVAYVPPLSPDLLAGLALAVWLAAWGVLALPERWRPRAARRIAGGGVVLSLAGFAALFELRDRLEARDLGVLVHGRSLVGTPAMDGAAIAQVGAGEAGRLGARESGWVYLTLDGARAGWVPASTVLPIEPVSPARLTGLAPLR